MSQAFFIGMQGIRQNPYPQGAHSTITRSKESDLTVLGLDLIIYKTEQYSSLFERLNIPIGVEAACAALQNEK